MPAIFGPQHQVVVLQGSVEYALTHIGCNVKDHPFMLNAGIALLGGIGKPGLYLTFAPEDPDPGVWVEP